MKHMMAKLKKRVTYRCTECQAEAQTFYGRCPDCSAWNSLQEILPEAAQSEHRSDQFRAMLSAKPVALPLDQIALQDDSERVSSGYPELDRVLGGGIIPGAYVLIGGDPGIGKSTLMLQMADKLAQQEKMVLYIAGEESPTQIKLRASRLGITASRILLFAQTNIQAITEEVKTLRPHVLIVDSIQAVYNPELSGTPGSTSQIRECASLFMTLAKALNIAIFLVGHVTKDGSVGGPKLLEHTVDTVLYFEGDKYRHLRILRAVKNRFGNTNEIGVFEILAEGLREISNPSELFLSELIHQSRPGSVVIATMEGNRPLLVELQALVGSSAYPSPRRVANGMDIARLHQMIAVLERRIGLDFSKHDVYVNVVGGLDINEPAADLGLALALVSSQHDVGVLAKTVFIGEVGLTGEVRVVGQTRQRVAEALKLGFEHVLIPSKSLAENERLEGCIEIDSVMQAMTRVLEPPASSKNNVF
jgi:DNA repair protein RadA/Sms